MKNWKIFLAALGTLAVGSTQAQSIADTAAVYLVADKGTYVGGTLPGGEALFRHGEGVSFRALGREYDASVYVYTAKWSFAFQAPEPAPGGVRGAPLTVGFYGGASRHPFNAWDEPGLDVNGDNRGMNRLSGWFNVLDVGYDSIGAMTRLAVDFRQFETTDFTGPSLFGSLRYNSPVAITSPVPEPATVAMLAVGVGLVAARRYRKA